MFLKITRILTAYKWLVLVVKIHENLNLELKLVVIHFN
nr:MAG TPA: hypothetical protein [Caudoviricetes sp.]